VKFQETKGLEIKYLRDGTQNRHGKETLVDLTREEEEEERNTRRPEKKDALNNPP
jgi:hypothetical protein